MKKSMYNFFFTTGDGKNIAFNTASCALAEADFDFMEVLNNAESINREELDEENRNYLDDIARGNFVVNEDYDERRVIEYKYNLAKFDNNCLSLTIAPTLECNFKCTYCYEESKKGFMSEEVQDAILAWIARAAESKKNIRVTWYGGEPILAKNIVFGMSEKIIQTCKENNVLYYSNIVSNSYLLNDEIIENLKKYNINSIQITLDGPKRIHDRKRVLKSNGEGTFDRIIENIKKVKAYEMSVCIRLNIDSANSDYIFETLDFLQEAGLGDVPLYLGHLKPYTEACQSVSETCLENEDFSKLLVEYYKNISSRGKKAFGGLIYPTAKGNYCSGDTINAYVVDFRGNLYKCWNELGNVKKSMGNVLNKTPKTPTMFMNEIKFIARSPFENEQCRDCNLLPLCMGGCPYFAVNDKPACEKWKYNLEEMVKLKYQASIVNEDIAENPVDSCS